MAKISKETDQTHFFGVGLQNTKNGWNIGATLRAAGCFGASFMAVSGNRFEDHKADFRHMDTEFARKRLPLFLGTSSLKGFIPFDCEIVVLERNSQSVSLKDFVHPRRAFYVFGPEDGSVDVSEFGPKYHSVYIPSTGSLNLAAATYITLYDRLTKANYSVKNSVCPNCSGIYIKTVNELTEDGKMLNHCNACGHEWFEEHV